MSFFKSVESHKKKILIRLAALDAHDADINNINALKTKKEIDNKFETYINRRFLQLLNNKSNTGLANRCCLAKIINPDCPCHFTPIEANTIPPEDISKIIKEMREARKAEKENPRVEDDCDKDILHHLTNYLIRANADYIPTDEKEKICKVLIKLFDMLDATTDKERFEKLNILLETNKSLYGTRNLYIINTAIIVIGLAVATAGILLMLTGFGLPIGAAVLAVSGAVMAAGTGAMIGGTIGLDKHSQSGSVVPKAMREIPEKLNPPKPGSK